MSTSTNEEQVTIKQEESENGNNQQPENGQVPFTAITTLIQEYVQEQLKLDHFKTVFPISWTLLEKEIQKLKAMEKHQSENPMAPYEYNLSAEEQAQRALLIAQEENEEDQKETFGNAISTTKLGTENGSSSSATAANLQASTSTSPPSNGSEQQQEDNFNGKTTITKITYTKDRILIRKERKILIPQEQYPTYNFIGKILGPRGHSLKRIEETSGCTVHIRGKGSIRSNRMLRGEEYSRYCLDQPLHLIIETTGFTEKEADEKLDTCQKLVEPLLVPVFDESQDEVKKRQLMELAEIREQQRKTQPSPDRYASTMSTSVTSTAPPTTALPPSQPSIPQYTLDAYGRPMAPPPSLMQNPLVNNNALASLLAANPSALQHLVNNATGYGLTANDMNAQSNPLLYRTGNTPTGAAPNAYLPGQPSMIDPYAALAHGSNANPSDLTYLYGQQQGLTHSNFTMPQQQPTMDDKLANDAAAFLKSQELASNSRDSSGSNRYDRDRDYYKSNSSYDRKSSRYDRHTSYDHHYDSSSSRYAPYSSSSKRY